MDHQSELEKSKYRNWVRGGLAYKYLKDGIEDFADELVQQEHKRILHDINHTPGTSCNRCSIRSLRPLHKRTQDPGTGKDKCPWSQINCSCLCSKTRPCRNKVCDAILEDILKSHGSQPPSPNWKNTDINSWCSMPWEIAKCFINAPGYAAKTTASEIDASGLLHVFINNLNLQNHVSCKIEVLTKTLKRRNTIFHSPTLEMEEKELNECIDDIITILQDEKELKPRNDAQKAVAKLRELKEKKFIVTTHEEVEICRTAVKSINNKLEDLQQKIQDIKSVEDALKKLETQSDSQLQTMKHTMEFLNERLKTVERDSTEMKQDIVVIKQRLTDTESDIVGLLAARDINKKQLDYVEQKQELQTKLVKLYKTHYVKSLISFLRTENNDIGISEVYVTPNMEEEVKSELKTEEETATSNLKAVTDKKASYTSTNKPPTKLKAINRYRDIFQTDSVHHRNIYIVGDAGAGKSSLAKMMIYNWCKAVTDDDENKPSQDEDVEEMKQFDFLFYIPLQRMSGLRCEITDMIKTHFSTSSSEELINSVFEKDSERCLIVADGLDEWTPPKDTPVPQHVSYGIPVGNRINTAAIVTFSRPSSRGVLNMKSSEYDKKIILRGIYADKINKFSENYMVKLHKDKPFIDSFVLAVAQSNLEHLERTPLLLQQLIDTYCEEKCIGKSVSDIYSFILNGMLYWFENKEIEVDEHSVTVPDEFIQLQLPAHLDRFPRCKSNKRFIFLLGKIAFKMLTGDTALCTFGRSKLQELGLTRNDITTLISLGILVEYTSLNPSYEKTCLSFIHISYLEFFAAVYISSHYSAVKIKRPISILKELFMRYKSASDILQLSNMLIMLCGLSPEIVGEMSYSVARNIEIDDSMIQYRNQFCSIDWWLFNFEEAPQMIQDLLFSCLSESGKGSQLMISLCDIVVRFSDSELIQNVVPDSVYSLYFKSDYMESSGKVSIDLAKYHHLQSVRFENLSTQVFAVHSKYLKIMSINNLNTKTDHEILEQLSSSVSRLPSLTHLTMDYLECNRGNCQRHTIDLSKLHDLQNIHLDYVAYTLPFPPVKNLVSFHYCGALEKLNHRMCKQIASSFVQAISLKHIELKEVECDRDNCTGHSVNLLKQTQLESIHLENFACKLDSVVQYKYLERVNISLNNGWDDFYFRDDKTVDHKICKQLISSVTHAVSLKKLTVKVKKMRCDRKYDEDNKIDLSKHDYLQSIKVHYFLCKLGSMLNRTNLKKIEFVFENSYKLKHEELEQLSTSLTQAESLHKLTLKNVTCIRENCEGHTIDLTKHFYLKSIHLEHVSTALLFPVNAKGLEYTNLRGRNDFKLAHRTCETISSLLTQAVLLEQLDLKNITCSSAGCEGHTIDLSKHDKLNHITLEGVAKTFVFYSYSKNLEKLNLSDTYCVTDANGLEHEQCEQISCAISQAVSLKHIELNNVACNSADCKGHTIDLSRHDRLHSIRLRNSASTFCSLINARNLEVLCISETKEVKHELLEQFLSSLSQAVSLKKLKFETISCFSKNCYGHTMNLSKLENLESISLQDALSTFIFVGTPDSLEKLNINDTCVRKIKTVKHHACEHLSLSISQSVSFKYLTLCNITCEKSNCEGHSVDLSKHDKLKKLDLSCFSVSNLNTRSLEKLEISAFPNVLNMCVASNLKELHIKRNDAGRFPTRILYTSSVNSAVQTLQNLQELHLQYIDIDENAFIVTPEMHNLKTLCLDSVDMSLRTWYTFVDSLLTLKQPVFVYTCSLPFTEDNEHLTEQMVNSRPRMFLAIIGLKNISVNQTAEEYVRQRTSVFEVLNDFRFGIDFSFKKISES